VPVYLQTYRIENVAWYRTLGFEVVSDGSRGDVPRGWGMRRMPRQMIDAAAGCLTGREAPADCVRTDDSGH